MKLPKQWKHWCRKAGLRPEYRPNSKGAHWGSLNGIGRKWRIALRDPEVSQTDCIFQAGDTYAEFDRWALSERINFEIPRTWAEFKAAIAHVQRVNRDGPIGDDKTRKQGEQFTTLLSLLIRPF